MQLKKLAALLLSSVVSAGCVLASAIPANASNLLSGVALGGSYKGSSTFLSVDPAFGLYPAYLVNTLKPGRYGSGWNLPAIDNGNNILPNVGRFNGLQFYYERANLGSSVDPNLNVVIQTNDGFSRIATATSVLAGNNNGFSYYLVTLLPTNFTPSFNQNETRLRTASVRYNGNSGPLYFIFPTLYGQNSILFYDDFNYRTVADPVFNNQ